MKGTPEHHRITCPYCVIGYALVTVYRDGREINLNLDDCPKCVCCDRYFRVQPQMQLVGVRLETFKPRLPQNQTPRVRAN